MRIFFILKNLYPYGKASTARVRSYAKGFTDNGITCNVIIPISMESYKEKAINTQSQGYYENTFYKYMSGSPKRSKNILVRQISDLFGYIKTLLYIKKNITKEDIVIIYEGGILWQKLCIKATHLTGAKAIMELNELPYGTGEETNRNQQLRNKTLQEVFPKYDGFLAISETLADLAKRYNKKALTIKVPILINNNRTTTPTLQNNKVDFIFHSGTLTEQKDGILGMIEAFGIAIKKIKTPLNFYLTGSIEKSPVATQIQELIYKYELKNKIFFTGYLNEEELRRYQEGCSLVIINKYNTQQNRYCFSTKLGEYLALKKPVIITNIGEAMNYLNETNAYIVEPGDPQLIANNIISIINNKEKSKRIAENAYQLTLKEFNSTYQTKRIISYFTKSLL